jgi:hypothetical protein
MGIPIASGENCLVVDSSDENLSKLLRGKACNIDELDFLTKRLDSFDSRELLTYYAAIAANKAETMAEQINLTFNTHCYSLVSDFSDLNAVGKNMYLNEQGSASAEKLQNFDGKAYFEEILARNPNPAITPYGILYTNSNQPDMAYEGKHFPLYFWKDEMAVLELRHDENSEFIYLPCTHRQTETALLRLEATSLHQCELTLISDHFSDKMLSIIIDEKPLAHNMDNLNYFATKLQEIGSNEEKYFEKLIDFIKPQSQEELKVLMESMYELELFEGIKNASQYGVYMICDSGHFTYDANLEDYIDFKGYGQQKIAGENGTFTDKGYIAYHGCNQEMARILNKNLGMQIELQQPQELKLYMPLKASTYYDENDYGDLYQVDFKIEVYPSELLDYEYEIKEALEKHLLPEESERGLMKYYGEHDSVNAKVKKYVFSVEEVKGKLMGVAELTLNSPLDETEMGKIKSEISGQASDGFGEGFEQREIKCNGKDVYVSFWEAENWNLKTAEELGITQQNHEMKFGGM